MFRLHLSDLLLMWPQGGPAYLQPLRQTVCKWLWSLLLLISLIPVKVVMGRLWRGPLNGGLTVCYLLRGAFGDGAVKTVLKRISLGRGLRPRLSESLRGRLDCVQLSKSCNLIVLLKRDYVFHSSSVWVKCPRHSDCVYILTCQAVCSLS